MGSSNSTDVKIDHYVWPEGQSHEIESNIINREKALISYEKDEKLSFGKTEPSIIRDIYNDDFLLTPKGQNYVDGERKHYAGPEKCCLIDLNYYKENNKIYTCDRSAQTFNSDFCDDVLFKTCILDLQNHHKCVAWIQSAVERNNKYVNAIMDLSFKPEFLQYRSHEYMQAFLSSLRNYASEYNNYNNMADNILNSYPEQIKYNEYKCAFSQDNINNQEKEIQTYKECWYKECVLSPVYKLKTENINKRRNCTISICDINIKDLKINNQDIQISCKNKFTNQTIDITDIALTKDKENLFFIPTFNNTVAPLLFLLFFIYFKK